MATFPVNIDARQLMYRHFIIPGITADWVSSRKLQHLQLATGSYSFQVALSRYADFTFTVSATGTVQYDPAFASFLGGENTSTLIVSGVEITIDASLLSGADPHRPRETGILLADMQLTHEDWIVHRTIRMVPMSFIGVQQSGGRPAEFTFAVLPTGVVFFDPRAESATGGFLHGNRTSTLILVGFTFLIDATQYSACELLSVVPVNAFPTVFAKKALVTLLPANAFFLQFQSGVVSSLTFNLTRFGTITVDPSQANVLSFSRIADMPTLTVSDYQAFSSPIFGNVFIQGPVLDRWKHTAAETTATGQNLQQYLGNAVENGVTLANGATTLQRFERGLVTQTGTAPAIVVAGEIFSRWHDMGEFESVLGSPISDETLNGAGGRVSHFDGGEMHWCPDAGAWSVQGAILARWKALNGPIGIMGCPISNELSVVQQGQEIGRVSRFEPKPRDGWAETVGTIYWSAATGAWEVYGPIFSEFQNQGGPAGPLGFPLSAPQPTPARGGQYQQFRNGLIVAYPGTGATTVLPPLALNLYSYAVNDDDFNVQINIFASSGESNHGRMPADGNYDQGTQDFPPQVLLQVNNVTPDLTIRIDQMEAIHERTFGEDDRKGDITKTFDINDVWGLQEPQRIYSNAQFTASFAVQPVNQPSTGMPFRDQYWWPFANFETDELSWQQYQDTFSDVAAVDARIKIIPPSMHLLEIAVYELAYKGLGKGGMCFGMSLESIYAREHRSLVANEPVFTDNSYRKDGGALDPGSPGDADTAYSISVKHGYQLGKDFIGWFIGKFTAGALHDPKRAFRESRDAFARGDWPMLTVSDGDELSQSGHALVPYRWDPPTEADIQGQPLSAQTWTIYVANPNDPATPGPPLGGSDDNAPQNRVTIKPLAQTFSYLHNGIGQPPWTGSVSDGGRLLTVPYSALTSQPQSPADLLQFLLSGAVLIILASDGGTKQISDHKGRTLMVEDQASGKLKMKPSSAAASIPVIPLLPNQLNAGSPELHVWQPDPSDATNQLVHKTLPSTTYDWSFHSAVFSFRVFSDAISTLRSSDTFTIDSIRTGQQTATIDVDPNGLQKSLQIEVAGWSGSDLTQSKWFGLWRMSVQPGHSLALQVLNAGQTMSIQNDGPDLTFILNLFYGFDNPVTATREALRLPASKTWRISLPSWDAALMGSTPVLIDELDRMGGTVERQFQI